MIVDKEIGGCINTVEGERKAVSFSLAMLDSGAYTHCCPPSFRPDIELLPPNSDLKLNAANGSLLKIYGRKMVPVLLKSTTGEILKVTIRFVVTDVTKPILSVPVLKESGYDVTFSNKGSFIEKSERRVMLEQCGRVYNVRLTHSSGGGEVCDIEAWPSRISRTMR